MDESILQSIKAMLGGNLTGDDTSFDAEIIPLINMALNTLVQLGAGPSQGYNITGPENKWSEFCGDDEMLLPLAREHAFLKVKIIWDSSTLSGAVIDVFKEQIRELECRIQYRCDPITTFK